MTNNFTQPWTIVLAITIFSAVSTAACIGHDPSESTARKDASLQCLPMLRENPRLFERCKTKICFLFVRQAPFIITPSTFKASNHADYQRPFTCSNHSLFHNHLYGTSFDLFREIPSEHLCIWAGDESGCTFHALVDFVDFHVNEYQFAIANMLVEIPKRHCRHQIGAPVIDENIRIVGRHSATRDRGPFSALSRLLSPFHWGAWMLLVGFCLVQGSISLIIVRHVHSDRQFSIRRALLLLVSSDALADDDEERLVSEQQKLRTLNLSLISLFLGLSVVSLLAVTILFYEIGVVNFLFQNQHIRLGKALTDLSRNELANYCAIKDSASESVWNINLNKRAARWNMSDEGAIPWKRAASGDECIDWILEDETNRYAVLLEKTANYLLSKSSSCDQFAIFQAEDILYTFNAAFLYSLRVNEETRRLIDSEILEMRLNGQILTILEMGGAEMKCSPAVTENIRASVVVFPVCFVVLPCMLMAMLMSWEETRRAGIARRAGIFGANDIEKGSKALPARSPSRSVSSVSGAEFFNCK